MNDIEKRRFERVLAHSVESVWEAITSDLGAWFPAVVGGALDAPGNDLAFAFPNGEEPATTGIVLVCEPPHRLVYTMGDETLHWELRPIPEGCLLVLETESTIANDTVCLAA